MEITGIMSIDLSDFNGPVLNGAVDGNNIVFKFWDASADSEFDVSADYSTGSGEWGDLFTAATLEPVYSVTQEIQLTEDILSKGLIDQLSKFTQAYIFNSIQKEIKKFNLFESWVVRQFEGEYNHNLRN